MKAKLQNFNRQLGSIDHIFVAVFVIFLLQQFSQMPSQTLNHNGWHDLGMVIVSLILYSVAIYWCYALISTNKNLDTHHELYNSIKYVCLIICTIIIINQFWAIYGTQLLHVASGGTSTNQAGLNDMRKTLAGSFLEWITVIFLGPITEETIFRYALIGPKAIRSKISRIAGTAISIIIFAGLHMIVQFLEISNTNQLHAAIFSFVQYLVISTIFSLSYYFRNNIRENIAIHMAYNIFAMLVSL